MDSGDDLDPQPPPRSRDKMASPSIDIAGKFIAFQRRNAAATKPRDRSDRPTPPSKRRAPSPSAAIHTVDPSADTGPNAEEFRRRLRISGDPPPAPRPHGKLHHLPEGMISVRRTTEPETISEGSSGVDQGYRDQPMRATPPSRESHPTSRQLFDHRKDDPVRFQSSILTRPVPTSKSSGDTFVSASSTSASSYAHSIGSSLTLTSNSTGTSGSSLSGLNPPPGEGEGNNAFVFQLKRLYREITSLEGKLTSEDLDVVPEEEPRFSLQARSGNLEKISEDRFAKAVNDHKRLADMMQKLMTMTLSPQVPASVHKISTKYNIPTRLWGNAFHRVLESLRRASVASPIALEHLTDMIFWAYSFYTALVEDPQVEIFKASWLEALGDLARYRMVVATFNPSSDFFGPSASLPPPEAKSHTDDSPSPSIGAQAALALEVEPEREQWRGTAQRWYSQGLQDTPGTGRLQHHLGLLSRDADNEDLRAVYHFVKSLTVTHPFLTSRESILPLFSIDNQKRRSLPGAETKELFLLLQGMLFTHVQLDDFSSTLSRFLERLYLDVSPLPEYQREHKQLEERDWIMMGIVNVAAMLEFGRSGACLKMGSSIGTTKSERDAEIDGKVLLQRGQSPNHGEDPDSKLMDIDDHDEVNGRDHSEGNEESTLPPLSEMEAPLTSRLALLLAFSVFKHALKNPTRKPTPFARSILNPYISIILTFLAANVKHQGLTDLLGRAVPWYDLVQFLNAAPRYIAETEVGGGARITQGCVPLPEDWCIRGMEWAARRTYERGFWKPEIGSGGELGVLNLEENGADATDGIIEDDEEEETDHKRKDQGETAKRWVRVIRASMVISRAIQGFEWNKEVQEWQIVGRLADKVALWQQEDRAATAAEELRKQGRRTIGEDMDVDDGCIADDSDSDDFEDPEDSEEIKTLKERRRHLQALLRSAHRHPTQELPRSPRMRSSTTVARKLLKMVPGYTVLVIDTNILLSSLSEFISLVESQKWTLIIPLAVITELDGLSNTKNDLGIVASQAVSFVSSHIRSHAVSLKVQTSKGNYMSTLNIRSEDVQFTEGESSWERNMDDLILRAAFWQDEHWVDRSRFLKSPSPVSMTGDASKVVLLSFDRNLRLKARARKLDVADHKDLASLLVANR